MMKEYLTEFIGTFVFLSVILKKSGALSIGIALACMLFFGNGHYNPAVSFMMMLKGKLSMTNLVPYVAAQLAGGASAVAFSRMK